MYDTDIPTLYILVYTSVTITTVYAPPTPGPPHCSYSGVIVHVIAHVTTLHLRNTIYVCKSLACPNSTNQPVAALSYQVHVKRLDNTLGWQCVITYTLQYQQQNYTTLAYWIAQHLFYLSCYQVMGTQ